MLLLTEEEKKSSRRCLKSMRHFDVIGGSVTVNGATEELMFLCRKE
jgi:hypothetical protein